MVSQSLMGLSAAWPLTTIDSRPGSYRRFLDGQRIAVLSPRLSRVEVWKELGEVRHLLVAVLVQPRPDAVREELNSRLGSGSQFLGIEIAQPEATAHLAPIVRVTNQVDQMARPHRSVERTDPRAHRSADPCIGEARDVEMIRGRAKLDLELHELAADALVYAVGSADVPPCAALPHPVAPDVIPGVPPLVVLGRPEKAEPEIDHPALAADHRSAAGYMERAVLEAQVAGLEGAACS